MFSALVPVLICKPEPLETFSCLELEDAIDEGWRFRVLRVFSLREEKILIFKVTAQKLESVRKVSELCVTDIYSEFFKSFHIQRGQTNNSLMTK